MAASMMCEREIDGCRLQAFVCDEDLEAYETYEDVARWQKSAREQGEAVYGAGNLQQRWSGACCSDGLSALQLCWLTHA